MILHTIFQSEITEGESMTRIDKEISTLRTENQQLKVENQELRSQLQEAQVLLRVQRLKAKKLPAFPRRPQLPLDNSSILLAGWRWRTQWSLLLVIGIGIVIAILLIGSLPLFSSVMTTAGLRNTLRAQPDSAQIISTAQVRGISTNLFNGATTQVNNLVQRDIGKYIADPPVTTLISSDWNAATPNGGAFDFYGVSLSKAATHLQILQGRLPAENALDTSSVEIMLTQTAALYLGNLKVGDTIPLSAQLFTGSASLLGVESTVKTFEGTLKAHLVGIFQVKANDPYWNGYTLEAPPPIFGTSPPPYLGLASQAAVLSLFDAMAQQHHVDNLYFQIGASNVVFLAYMLDTPHITASKLEDLIARSGSLQQDVEQTFAVANGSNIVKVEVSGATLHGQGHDTESTLEKFLNQEAILQTPMLILSIEILCLILFFISTMIETLVEREQASIALLRSRGANRRQVFGSLLTQGLVLCMLGGLAGPLLAISAVHLLAPFFLTPGTQDALNALTIDPEPALHALRIYTLIAVAVIFLTLVIFFYRAVRANILARRREETRSTQLPLWQRLRLDLVIVLLASGGYVLTLYLENTASLLSDESQALVSTPLQLLAPALLLLAAILIFLRLFPRLLRLIARLTLRKRDLNAMLAFVHMARSPHRPIRLALLLGLATAFTFFSLIFSASQSQRAQDIAFYQAISDFNGYVLNSTATDSANATSVLNATASHYQQIPGVTSATVGYITTLALYIDSATSRSTILNAVDADTFARTVRWPSQASSQSLTELMQLLASQRTQAIQNKVVPAIVTASTWQMLDLTRGQTFNLNNENGSPDPITYVAVAEVQHIPPLDDAHVGALLVDYTTLAAAKAQYAAMIQPNYAWLNTSDNPTVVNQVRKTLSDPAFALSKLIDRRAFLDNSKVDPLANNLLCLLSVGVSAALLLAFLANLLLPLLSVRARQTNFAVLRALGMPPRQIARMLTWELVIVLATSLLLGLCFGTLLALALVPPLVFTGVLPTNLIAISGDSIYTLQYIVPVTIVLPPSLLLALVILLALSLIALALMTRLAQRPLMALALRLDED